MDEFKKWWGKQNDLTIRMATPENIAKAAWEASTPDTHVSVPVEPTKEMVDAGCDISGCHSQLDKAIMLEEYKAMIKEAE